MRTKLTIACAAMAFVAIAGGTAEATGLIHTGNIAAGAITFDKLSPGVQKHIWDNGKNGTNGNDGATGATGAIGATGAAGPKGATGATGAQGAKGDAGADGAQGPNGLKGDTGLKGATGAPGAKGDTGADGAQGPQGLTGDPGLKGETGDTGPVGPAGADSNALRAVTAANLNGFVLSANGDNGDPSPNGTVSFVAAADAPKGQNVLDMQTITGKSVVAYLPSAAGRLLSELTSFGYASKVIAAPNPAYDVTAQIEVIKSASTYYSSGYTTVVFEPYVNGNQGAVGWHRNDMVHGKVWSTKPLPSGDCSQAVPCAFSTFIAQNPQAIVLSAPKFRIGQNSGTPANDAGHYQVDDVIFGFGTALNFDLGA
jgi:hypothetical protein